jgi:hypothetical protein
MIFGGKASRQQRVESRQRRANEITGEGTRQETARDKTEENATAARRQMM